MPAALHSKSGPRIEFLMAEGTWDRRMAAAFGRLLIGEREGSADLSDKLDAHLDILDQRAAGLSWTALLHQKGIPRPLHFNPRVLASAAGLMVFDVDTISVSFDVFNAWNEEGLPGICGIDLFLVESRQRGRGIPRMSQLAEMLAEHLPPSPAFGGDSALLARYVGAVRAGQAKAEPWRYLWLWNFLPWPFVERARVEQLRVFRTKALPTGAVIQVFEDLTNGQEDVFDEAGRALGLPPIWGLGNSDD